MLLPSARTSVPPRRGDGTRGKTRSCKSASNRGHAYTERSKWSATNPGTRDIHVQIHSEHVKQDLGSTLSTREGCRLSVVARAWESMAGNQTHPVQSSSVTVLRRKKACEAIKWCIQRWYRSSTTARDWWSVDACRICITRHDISRAQLRSDRERATGSGVRLRTIS